MLMFRLKDSGSYVNEIIWIFEETDQLRVRLPDQTWLETPVNILHMYIEKKASESIITICDYSHCRGLFLEDVGSRKCAAIIKVLFGQGSVICDCAIVQDLPAN